MSLKNNICILILLFNSGIYCQLQQDISLSLHGTYPVVAIDKNVVAHIIWDENFTSVAYASLDSKGDFITNKIILSPYNGDRGTTLALSDTLIVAAWGRTEITFNSYIEGQLLTISGEVLGNNIRFNDPYFDAIRFRPDAVWINDSIYVVVWNGEGPNIPFSATSIFGQFMKSDGSFIGNNFIISDHSFEDVDHSPPKVINIPDYNKFLVIWRDNYVITQRLWGRLFNHNGLPLEQSFLISDSLSTYDVWFTDCAMDTLGNIAVLWGEGISSDGGFIKWRWMDSNGKFLDETETLLSDVGSIVGLSLSMDFNNNIIIVWEDERSGKPHIYGQRYKPDRTKLGNEFKVSTRSSDNIEFFPEVALRDNKIFIVWEEVLSTTWEVWASIYNYDLYLSSTNLDFGNVEVNTISKTRELVISNYSDEDLIISDIAGEVGPFTRISNHNFPLTLSTNDSVTVEITLSPPAKGSYEEILLVTTNNPDFPEIDLKGYGYEMHPAFTNIFYASTGSGDNGDILLISRETGEGTTLGNSLFKEIKSLSVNPADNVIYGLIYNTTNSEIVRVNAKEGDAYELFNLPIPALTGIAFDTTGSLYAVKETGEIYQIDLGNGSYTLVTTADVQLNAIAFHPSTNQLWAGVRKTFGPGKDSVYVIELTTGAVTPIGVTGLGVMTNDLAFDENSNLYGVTRTSNQEGKLFTINQVDGTATPVGDIGYNHVLGLAYSINGKPVDVEDGTPAVPNEYRLFQNYPNPFNPSTNLKYQIPQSGFVTLKVYDILGNEIAVLVNEDKLAGRYEIKFDASGLATGVYFYRLNVNDYVSAKKMILLR